MNTNDNATKTHFKMYKSGKRWLYASVTTFGAILGMTVMGETVHADQNADQLTTSQVTPVVGQVEETKSLTPATENSAGAPDKANDSATKTPDQTDTSNADSGKDGTADTPIVNENSGTPDKTAEANDKPVTTPEGPTDKPSATPEKNDATTNADNKKAETPADTNDSKTSDTPTKTDDSKTPTTPTQGKFGTSDWTFDKGTLTFQDGSLGVVDNSTNNVVLGTSNLATKLGLNPDSITTIDFATKVIANSDSTGLFANLKNLTTILHGDNFDTANAENFSLLFYNDTALTNLDFAINWHTDNVTNMFGTFLNNRSLSNIDAIKKWKTGKVITMERLFGATSALTDASAVEGWQTDKVETFQNTFAESGIEQLDLSGWNVSSATNMALMFNITPNLTSLNLSGWKVSNVKSFGLMFATISQMNRGGYESKLASLNLTGWEAKPMEITDPASGITSFQQGFYGMFYGQNELKSLDLSGFDMSDIQDFVYQGQDQKQNGYFSMLSGMTSLQNLKLGANTKLDSALLTGMTTSGTHTGWFLLGTDNPYQSTDISSADLMSEYDGQTLVPGTYVTNSQAILAVTPTTTITAGTTSKFDAKSLITGGTNFYGQKLTDFADVTITGDTVDPQKAGTYHLTFTYTDEAGNKVSAKATVTVVNPPAPVVIIPSQASLTVTPTANIVAGPSTKFNPTSLITGLTNFVGTPLTDFSSVHISGNVDSSKPGNYSLTFTYNDGDGNIFTKTATVKVVPSQANLNVTPTATVMAGPSATFDPMSLITGLTDVQGKPLTDFTGVKVTVTDTTNNQPVALNLSTPGTYAVTYAYTDAAGNVVTQTANVHVTASKAALTVTPTATINTDAPFDPTSLITNLTAADGTVLKDYRAVNISGTVDPTTAGAYPLTYSYTDAAGNVLTATTTVNVAVAHDDQTPAGGAPTQPTDSNNATAPTQSEQPAPISSNDAATPTTSVTTTAPNTMTTSETASVTTATQALVQPVQIATANRLATPKHTLTNAPTIKQASAIATQLPQTDENSTSGLWLTIGGIFLAGATLLGLRRKHH